jgi:uncharacterized membrane protein YhiD involved in acid resistance
MTAVEWTIVLRAVIAGLLGYLIGWERNVFGEPVRARAIALAGTTAATLVALTHA